MDFTNVELSEPIEPEIELDGDYCYCKRCKTELEPISITCPMCYQLQDWSWFIITKRKGIL